MSKGDFTSEVNSLAEVQFDWKSAELVDFKVMNEDWQCYTLSDQSRIRVKLILVQVWRSKVHNPLSGEPLYSWNTQNALALVSYPNTLLGQPTAIQITPETIAQNVEQTVDFDLSGKQDEWSSYTLDDESKLRLRLNLTSVYRTKLRGQAGEPVYSISTGLPNYRLTVSPSLIEKSKIGTVRADSKSPAYG
jgi:hypothetical protein